MSSNYSYRVGMIHNNCTAKTSMTPAQPHYGYNGNLNAYNAMQYISAPSSNVPFSYCSQSSASVLAPPYFPPESACQQSSYYNSYSPGSDLTKVNHHKLDLAPFQKSTSAKLSERSKAITIGMMMPKKKYMNLNKHLI